MAVTGPHPTVEQVWQWLGAVPDPEIPVVSVTDLGIVREVAYEGDNLHVVVTPTYSGCPATSVIALDIENALRTQGLTNVVVSRRLSPAWTADWITQDARDRLKAYGIAPPVPGTAADGRLRAARLGQGNLVVPCPRCDSNDTERISQFGSTPCKAQYRCRACLEPFDYFKCI